MTPRLRRTRWRAATALLGGLLLTLAAGPSVARAQGFASSLVFNPPADELELPAPAAAHPEARRGIYGGIQLARLAPPPGPRRSRRREAGADAPPDDSSLGTGETADARLLLFYTLLPGSGAGAPASHVSLFAEEAPAGSQANETRWRMIATTGNSAGGDTSIRFIGENEQFLSLAPSASPSDPLLQANRQELLLLNMEQRRGRSAYGAAYRYEGPDRRSSRKYGRWVGSSVKWRGDQESLEAWQSQRFGDTRLKLSVAEFRGNPDHDPARYGVESAQAALSLTQRLGGAPLYLTLSGSRGASRTLQEPRGRQPFSRAWNTYNAALSYYPDSRWDAYLSSGYSSAGDLSRTGDAGELHWHEAGLSIHPAWSILLKPVVALGNIRNDRTGERIDYPFASLSLTFFDLLPKTEVTLWSSYARMTSRRAALDATSADAYLRLARKLSLPGRARATLSLDIGWSGYRDRLAPGRSSEGFSGMALLRCAF